MKNVKGGTRAGAKKWPSKLLLSTASEVGAVAFNTEGISPRWPVPLHILVSVFRGEDAKMKAIENYTVPSTQTPKVDDDDGDD